MNYLFNIPSNYTQAQLQPHFPARCMSEICTYQIVFPRSVRSQSELHTYDDDDNLKVIFATILFLCAPPISIRYDYETTSSTSSAFE